MKGLDVTIHELTRLKFAISPCWIFIVRFDLLNENHEVHSSITVYVNPNVNIKKDTISSQLFVSFESFIDN